jgi:hypothetical protein
MSFAAAVSMITYAAELEPLCVAIDVVAPEILAKFSICPVSKGATVSAALLW